MRFKSKKFYSLLLAGAMTITTAFSGYSPKVTSAAVESSYVDTAKAVDTQSTDVTQLNQNGLANSVGEGVILHCWNWSFDAIKSEMANIAAAGYTAVQTSPVQRPKDYTSVCDQYGWWEVYQPTTLCFAPDGQSWFGTKAEFKAMCDEADKYGIKVIVDVVANHMANVTGEIGNYREDISNQIDPIYYKDNSCWHLNGSHKNEINYTNAYRGNSRDSLTRGFLGMPDLNTGNSKVQQGVLGLLKECINLGADGFRFDAAKHIELPSDPEGSDFWTVVIDVAKAADPAIHYSGQNSTDVVLWAESHDTYANDKFSGPSAEISQEDINKTWAIVASRKIPSLYYVRPGNKNAVMGTKSTNRSWEKKEVAEVNKFHNYYIGKTEYLGYDGSIVYDVRNKDGVVLVNVRGNSASVNVALANSENAQMKDGEYVDHVTGNKFTVSSGRISGQIGDTGIAVIYNANVEPSASASVADNNNYTYTF